MNRSYNMKKHEEASTLDISSFDVLDASDILSKIDNLVSLSPEVHEETTDKGYGKFVHSEDWLKSNGFSNEQIAEIKRGIENNIDVEKYANENVNWMQMREIRLGIMQDLDISVYNNPFYTSEQMREIRLGLLAGLDVSGYARLRYTSKDMAKFRKNMLKVAYNSDPSGFASQIIDEDTGIIIRVSDDCMEAFITCTVNTDLTVGEIKRVLAKNDILVGIIDDEVKKAADAENIGKEFKIASGIPEKKGTDGKYEFMFDALLPGKPVVLEDGSVDYTQVKDVDRVYAGEPLARYYPPVKGINGMTVTGITIQGHEGKELPELTGQGFVFDKEKQTYTATINGFAFADTDTSSLNVWNVFLVEGDVNRYTGHITYDGIVNIKGNVGDGAYIEASANIVVDGVVEGATLYAGKNIILKKGINGGDKGVIKAGLKVIGHFFEAVNIEAGDDVEGNYFMNCEIKTDGKLIARGQKGRIIGGNIHALMGVEAMSIGNHGSQITTLDVGNTESIEDRRRITISKIGKIENELYQLDMGKQRLIQMLGEDNVEQNKLYQKTVMAMEIVKGQHIELDNYLTVLDSLIKRAIIAEVRVHSTIQDGVRVIMGGKRTDIPTTTGKKVIRREVKGENKK